MKSRCRKTRDMYCEDSDCNRYHSTSPGSSAFRTSPVMFFTSDLPISCLRWFLFNRWGQVIFETRETGGRGWDGKVNGCDRPAGVYVYLTEAEFENGVMERHQGNVTLIR